MLECPYIKKGLTIKHNGVMIPCCLYNDTHNLNIEKTTIDDFFKDSFRDELKRLMENNQWPIGCMACKLSEINGQTSMRINSLAQESKLFDKYYIDLDIGDECNSDCVMCTPMSSSKIRSRIKNHGDIKEIEYDLSKLTTNWAKEEKFWNNLADNIDRISCIKFLGGEPFMIKNIWRWIEKESVQSKKHNIILQITTNASILYDQRVDLLNGWKELIINVSADSTGKQFEWIRHGLDWNTVEYNTRKLINLKKSTVSIQYVANVYSITGVYDLLNWINELDCLFTFIPLTGPKFLSLKYAPVDVLTLVLDQISQIKMKRIQNQINLNSLKKFIKKSIAENQHNPDLLKKITDYFNNHRTSTMDPCTLRLIENEK